MVEKKEGNTMTCKKCGTDVICRLKDYGGNFAPSLQWQNFDGAAHYKTSDGKRYDCNVPDEKENEQTRISTPPTTTPGDLPAPKISPTEFSFFVNITKKIEELELTIQRIHEMIEAIFQYTVDEQLKKK